jgi:Rad3-related DNA helicase
MLLEPLEQIEGSDMLICFANESELQMLANCLSGVLRPPLLDVFVQQVQERIADVISRKNARATV